jgi:hypothetical protein
LYFLVQELLSRCDSFVGNGASTFSLAVQSIRELQLGKSRNTTVLLAGALGL